MPKQSTHRRREEPSQTLKGWKAIASYLGVGTTTAQRWAKDGMPVERDGRFTIAHTDQLRAWCGHEAHMSAPAYVLTAGSDISGALEESISAVSHQKRTKAH